MGGPWIVVDVNNFQKGPNQFGRDVFVIKLTSDIKKGEHYIKAMGAEGTFDKTYNGNVCMCGKDYGLASGSYYAGEQGVREVVSGVCCSAYYLSK